MAGWRDTIGGIAVNAKRKKAHDNVTWTPRDPGKGMTYARDGATGEPVRSTWPRCGHSCRECWPEGRELS